MRQSLGKWADWKTSLSGKSLVFRQLVDDGKSLVIRMQVYDGAEPGTEYNFEWTEFCAYRNTLEEQRLPWDLDNEPYSSSFGPTHEVSDSAWIAELRFGNDLFDLLHPAARHFVIGTGDYWTEIISNQEPTISPAS